MGRHVKMAQVLLQWVSVEFAFSIKAVVARMFSPRRHSIKWAEIDVLVATESTEAKLRVKVRHGRRNTVPGLLTVEFERDTEMVLVPSRV